MKNRCGKTKKRLLANSYSSNYKGNFLSKPLPLCPRGSKGHFATYYSSRESTIPIKDVNNSWKENHTTQPEYQNSPPTYMIYESCCLPNVTKKIVSEGIKYLFWVTRYEPFPEFNPFALNAHSIKYIVSGFYEIESYESINGRFPYCWTLKKCKNFQSCYGLIAKKAYFVCAKDAFELSVNWWNSRMQTNLKAFNKLYLKREISNPNTVQELLSHFHSKSNILSKYIEEEKQLRTGHSAHHPIKGEHPV